MSENQDNETPYNNKNILIKEDDINNILRKYGIKMKCINIC